eukprot:7382646-Prymnesium_polylepis.2
MGRIEAAQERRHRGAVREAHHDFRFICGDRVGCHDLVDDQMTEGDLVASVRIIHIPHVSPRTAARRRCAWQPEGYHSHEAVLVRVRRDVELMGITN